MLFRCQLLSIPVNRELYVARDESEKSSTSEGVKCMYLLGEGARDGRGEHVNKTMRKMYLPIVALQFSRQHYQIELVA